MERLRRHPRLSRLWKRAPAACTPRVLGFVLWNRWKCSESTPLSVPAVDSHFGRGPKKVKTMGPCDRVRRWRRGSPGCNLCSLAP